MLPRFSRLYRRQAETLRKWTSESATSHPTSSSSPSPSPSSLSHIHIIIGNEASDLDSMVSSVAYAYMKHLSITTEEERERNAYLPVFNIPRKQFRLRPEAPFVFEQSQLKEEDLLFLDDVDLVALSSRCSPFIPEEKKENEEREKEREKDKESEREKADSTSLSLGITLVDHNSLATSQQYLSPFIESIIDHHKDEGLFHNECKNGIRIVETMGSCATLISELIPSPFIDSLSLSLSLSPSPTLSSSSSPTPVEKEIDRTEDIADLLLSAILLDTGNMNPSLKKGLKRDENAIFKLNSKHKGGERTEKDLQIYHDLLASKRQDSSSLSTEELLIKDAKRGLSNGIKFLISTVPLSFEEWRERDVNFEHSILSLLKEEHIDILAIMTTFVRDGLFSRQLLICSTSSHSLSLSSLHRSFSSSELDLSPLSPFTNEEKCIYAYSQKEVKHSRKKVMPLMTEYLSKL